MNYPEAILPSSIYLKPFPIEKLTGMDFFVSRRIDGKIEDNCESFNGKERLDPDCLGSIVDMSVNLLGGNFLSKDTAWRQIGKGKELWDGISDINITDYEGNYILTDNDAVFYKGSLLHHATYPNEYSFRNNDQYKAFYKSLKRSITNQFEANRKEHILVNLTLSSAPTNLNYWHFEMKATVGDENVELKNDKSWREMLFQHLLNTVLCQQFESTVEEKSLIDSHIYKK